MYGNTIPNYYTLSPEDIGVPSGPNTDTNTIYVANAGDNTVSVIDGNPYRDRKTYSCWKKSCRYRC